MIKNWKLGSVVLTTRAKQFVAADQRASVGFAEDSRLAGLGGAGAQEETLIYPMFELVVNQTPFGIFNHTI